MIERSSNIEDLRNCQIVFVSASEGPRVSQIAAALKGLPILLVGEMDGFAEQWGIVNFISESNKVRFEVNIEAAKRTELQISGRLLQLAKIVDDRHSRPGRFIKSGCAGHIAFAPTCSARVARAESPHVAGPLGRRWDLFEFILRRRTAKGPFRKVHATR